ncbi:restriction endonuclease, partial [Streptomyces sp. NPDC046862]
MFNEAALLESKALRESVVDRTDVLDKVKALSLLPDGLHVTTAMVATYFEVAERAINSLLQRHRGELEVNGLHVLRGSELQEFKSFNLKLYPERYPQPRSSLALWPRRAVHTDATSLDDRIDQRITHILGRTVVPMFNALIETSGEHRREL